MFSTTTIILCFTFLNFLVLVRCALELPAEDSYGIIGTEWAIRNTVNNLFSTLKLKVLQQKLKLKQYSTIHNFFASITLRDHHNLKKIVKLTHVGNIDNGTQVFITQLNEVLNDDNKSDEATDSVYVTILIEEFIRRLDNLKETNDVKNNTKFDLNKAILRYFSNNENEFGNTTYLSKRNASDDDVLSSNEFWQPSGRRIFGGETTTIEHFPFMASVQFFKKFQCAGSIIKSDLVITSASCVQIAWNNRLFRENPAFLSVQVGSTYYERSGENIAVVEIEYHPGFNPRNLRHNLALMRLTRTLKFRSIKRKLKKIDFDKHPWPLPTNTDGIVVVGWGSKTFGNKIKANWKNELSYSTLDFYPLEECQEIYTKEFVTDRNFCGGFFSKGGGACNHDTGGPGVSSGILTGVISFGSPQCGTPDAPTVFTKLGYYTDWIEEIMEKKTVTGRQQTTMRPPNYNPTFPPITTKARFRITPIIRGRKPFMITPIPGSDLRANDEKHDFKQFLKTIFKKNAQPKKQREQQQKQIKQEEEKRQKEEEERQEEEERKEEKERQQEIERQKQQNEEERQEEEERKEEKERQQEIERQKQQNEEERQEEEERKEEKEPQREIERKEQQNEEERQEEEERTEEKEPQQELKRQEPQNEEERQEEKKEKRQEKKQEKRQEKEVERQEGEEERQGEKEELQEEEEERQQEGKELQEEEEDQQQEGKELQEEQEDLQQEGKELQEEEEEDLQQEAERQEEEEIEQVIEEVTEKEVDKTQDTNNVEKAKPYQALRNKPETKIKKEDKLSSSKTNKTSKRKEKITTTTGSQSHSEQNWDDKTTALWPCTIFGTNKAKVTILQDNYEASSADITSYEQLTPSFKQRNDGNKEASSGQETEIDEAIDSLLDTLNINYILESKESLSVDKQRMRTKDLKSNTNLTDVSEKKGKKSSSMVENKNINGNEEDKSEDGNNEYENNEQSGSDNKSVDIGDKSPSADNLESLNNDNPENKPREEGVHTVNKDNEMKDYETDDGGETDEGFETLNFPAEPLEQENSSSNSTDRLLEMLDYEDLYKLLLEHSN